MRPIQPISVDGDGIVRFEKNAIVRRLLDYASDRGLGLNELAAEPYSQEDRVQFAQLIGYSLAGYGDLSCVTDKDFELAENAYRSSRAGAKPAS